MTIAARAGLVNGWAYMNAVLASEPFAFWPLDDPTGQTARELVFGRSARISGGVARGVPDPWGAFGAMRFDGTGAVVQSAVITRPTSAVSIECWYRASDVIQRMSAVEFNASPPDDDPSTTFSPSLFIEWGEWSLWGRSFGGVNEWVTDPSASTDGDWHHGVLTFDGDETLSIYRDGLLRAQTPSAGNTWLGPGYWRIGDGAVGAPFTGDLSCVSVYDRALSPEEISEHVSATDPRTARGYSIAVQDSHPVAYWPLDDEEGSSSAREIIAGATATAVDEPAFGVADPWGSEGAVAFDHSFIFETTRHPPWPLWTVELWYRSRQSGIGGITNYNMQPDSAMVSSNFTPAIYLGASGILTGFASPAVLGDGVTRTDDQLWHHVGFTFDGSTLALMVDGIRRNTIPGQLPQNWPNAGLQIGVSGNSARGGFFIGDVCHVAVYDRALTLIEVAAHFSALEPPPEPEPEPELPPPPLTHEYLDFIAADGRSVSFEIERGMTGRLMPPVDVWEDIVPLVAGSRFRGARHSARNIVVPIVTKGIVYGRDELRQLASVLDPVRGMGRLRVVGGPSDGREIPCVYQAGLDSVSEDYPHFSRASILFRATDPYWTDGHLNEQTFVPGQTQSQWFPIFPIELGAIDVFARFTIVNAGDVISWPEVLVNGPGSDFAMDNITTGQSLWVHGAIPNARRLVVTTKPGQRAVSLDQDNWFSHLDRDSSLWGLVPGPNVVQIRYTSVFGSVTLRWMLNYLAP